MIRNPKDFWTGLIYIFFGASAILIARDYSMGTAVKMGPAYFPTILGGLLLTIGVISVIRSFVIPGPAIGALAIKGLVLVTISVVVFGFVVRGLGVAIALPLLIIVSAYDGASGGRRESSDARDGGGAHYFLCLRVSERFGHSAADHRSVARRLNLCIANEGHTGGITESSCPGVTNRGDSR